MASPPSGGGGIIGDDSGQPVRKKNGLCAINHRLPPLQAPPTEETGVEAVIGHLVAEQKRLEAGRRDDAVGRRAILLLLRSRSPPNSIDETHLMKLLGRPYVNHGA